jgi:hypothetical protein
MTKDAAKGDIRSYSDVRQSNSGCTFFPVYENCPINTCSTLDAFRYLVGFELVRDRAA